MNPYAFSPDNNPFFWDHFQGKHPVTSGVAASGITISADSWEISPAVLDANQGRFQKTGPSVATITFPAATNNANALVTPKGGQNDYFVNSGDGLLIRAIVRPNWTVSGADQYGVFLTTNAAASGTIHPTGILSTGAYAGVATVSGHSQWSVVGQAADGTDRSVTRTATNVAQGSGKYDDIQIWVTPDDQGAVLSGVGGQVKVQVQINGMPVVDRTTRRPIQTKVLGSGFQGKPVIGVLQGGASVASLDVDLFKIINGTKTADRRPQ